MILASLMAFLHFAAVFGIVGALVYQRITFSRNPTLAEARHIQACDRMYGISATLLLIVGALRVVYFEKGWAFYGHSPFFHAKMALFVAVGLMSIYPTIKFAGWGKATSKGQAPTMTDAEYATISRVLKLEMMGLFAIALCASLMAKGVGI